MMSYGYQTTTVSTFVPPQAFISSWYFSIYQSIQQHELIEMSNWFRSVDLDRSGTITANELQYLSFGNAPLGIETSIKLIKVFDCNRNNQIDFFEYAALHQFIKNLRAAFAANDRNYSGTIDAHEIHNALISSGFHFLQFHTVNYLFLKLSPSGYGLQFNQFVSLCATVALTRSIFERNDLNRSGVIHLNMGQLIDIVALV